MKIKQFISGRWPGLKALALCAMAATAFVACKDDETDVVRDPHITLSEDAFLYNAAGETHSFTVYSNIDWKVEMADTSQTWVNIWPKEGSDDGVFAVKVSKQPSKDPVLREAASASWASTSTTTSFRKSRFRSGTSIRRSNSE